VGPGYWATAGTGLTLNLAAATAFCGNPPVAVAYAGGTLAMTDATTNYVFLNPAATCAPASNTTGFSVGHIPVATVVTAGGVITTITDRRSWFAPAPCAMSSSGAVICGALGTNQNITLTPSGTGFTILNGSVGIGTSTPGRMLHVYGANPGIVLEGSSGAPGLELRVAGANITYLDFATGATDLSTPDYSSRIIRNSGTGGSFDFVQTGSGNFTFTGGNVGIGTVGPDSTLHVIGGVCVEPTDSGCAASTGTIRAARASIAGLNTVTFLATPTFDAALGNTQKITLTGNVTSSTLSNATAGQALDFIICQDATGSRTFVWPTNVKGGVTIGSTLSTCNAQNFIFDGTNAYALSSGVINM
jgi:hypothetical protein